MNHYLVKWEIDIDAETPEEAAKKALEIHRDPESCATVFEVYDVANGIHGVTVDAEEAEVSPCQNQKPRLK